MPVRFRITFLFSLLAFLILGFVCSGIYYFSYMARTRSIRTRLTNRAITTARLLSHETNWDPALLRQVDSLTTISLKNKVVQAYDYKDRLIYHYNDQSASPLPINSHILDEARIRGDYYFVYGKIEAVAYHYTDDQTRIVVISSGLDKDGRDNLVQLRNILLFGFLGGNILVLMSGLYFSARLLDPIRRITREVTEISALNLTRRLHTGEVKDEWTKLAMTLNDLLDRLQESFELQRRFISNASHELSTPLTSISSQLEVTLQRERPPEEYREVLHSVYQDVRNLGQLTQVLLAFAKASGNGGGLELKQVRIDEVLLRLPGDISRTNAAYKVDLHFNALPEEADHLLVYGNEALLFTAVKNLVVNACKYSSDNQAHVHLKVKKNEVLILVRDKGIGMTEQELRHIFQPFYRVEENLQGGFGLGLALTERIIKMHKGSIEVSSEKDRGTCFTVRLPASIL